MRKIFIYILLTVLLVSCFASPTKKAFAANISDNSVIILSGETNDNNTLKIVAKLVSNSGIGGMQLELNYDKDAMVLSDIIFGSALESLKPITSGTISYYPYKINYIGDKNDFSTGMLFTLIFKINDDINDGNYNVSLKYEKNKDVVYYDSNKDDIKTKNLYIDNTEIEIKNNSVVKVVSVKDTERSKNTWTIVIIVSSVVIIAGAITTVILLKKRRNWKRL